MELQYWREETLFLFYSLSTDVHFYCSLLSVSPFSPFFLSHFTAVIGCHFFWLCFLRQSCDNTDSTSHTAWWVQNTLKFLWSDLLSEAKANQTNLEHLRKKSYYLEWDVHDFEGPPNFCFSFNVFIQNRNSFRLRNSLYLSHLSHSLAPENTSVKCSS